MARRHSGRLRAFQDAFAAALIAPGTTSAGAIDAAPEIARLVAQPGFAVYRNTVLKGCIDALQANYPAVSRIVGDERFRAAAAIYARANLPPHPSLVDYGAGFAAFLAAFEPAAELTWLPGVARLDRFWTEAHVARDDVPVAAATVAAFAPAELAGVVLFPHASARWAWFEDASIATLWERNRPAEGRAQEVADALPDLDGGSQGVLLTRPQGKVEWTRLPRAGCAFLDACGAGRTLAGAASAALDIDRQIDLAALMARLLDAGAFARVEVRADDAEALAR
jgi:hypothetical protein